MKDKRKAGEIASQRVQLLAPILAEGLDAAKIRELKSRIIEQNGISERTLRRWLAEYRKEGFEGLKPKGKGRSESKAISPYLLEQAIILRREVPTRSIGQIIQILEWEGKAQSGEIKRSTLQEKLAERGYSTRHMRLYSDSGVAARRFQRRHRNDLWHSDIKFSLFIPIGPNRTKKQVYLAAFLDDATRYVLHAEFYPTLDQAIIEDCFRKSIQKHGLPDRVYFDNGKQYRNRWMMRTCSVLGIKLLFARPYSPESTGKIEVFNRLITSFQHEAKLENVKTLEQLNELFRVWLSECYQYKSHSALPNGISPEAAYRSDKKTLRFADPEILANAFLHSETRKVDKAGCISFMNKKYEVGISFVGCKVEVVYDPADITELSIEYKDHPPWTARELVIGERAGKRPPMPEFMQPQPAESSRLLAGAQKINQQRQVRQAQAISYRSVRKEETRNV